LDADQIHEDSESTLPLRNSIGIADKLRAEGATTRSGAWNFYVKK